MKKKLIGRMSAVALTAALVVSLAGCGGGGGSESTTAAAGTTAAAAENGTTAAAGQGAANVEAAPPAESVLTEPVTVTLWHSRGSGVHLEEMQRVVEEFNKTNGMGITVVEEYIGGNSEIDTKLATSIAAGDNCQIALCGYNSVGGLAAEDVLADMLPFAVRDGFDLDNLLPCFNVSLYFNGELLAMPYIRSASLLYCNMDLFKEAGYDTIPMDMNEFNEAKTKIKEQTGKAGIGIIKQPDFVQGAWTKSINGIGDVSEDGLSPLSFEDGSLREVTEWWLNGVNDGTILKYTTTSDGDNMISAFLAGDVASIPQSCAQIGRLIKGAEENGFELGVTALPGFRGEAISSTGGSNMVIVKANCTDAQIEASWQFLKFLVSDEQMVQNCIDTGYLPVTTSAGENQKMIDFWAENEAYKTAYDTLSIAIETRPSFYIAAWNDVERNMWDSVIQDNSMTLDEGMKFLEDTAPTIWPAK